ncbi:MAG: translation initiation factor IF-2 subunit beta [Candidatus Micrarchaeia archaeon]
MDYSYDELLDRAFAQLPSLSEENIDFKIPIADSIIQGNKSIIRNFSQIADAARRNAKEMARYMSKELAAPASVEEGRLIISKKVRSEEINEKIKKYFQLYVICKECYKPDTRFESVERGFVNIVCEACGARYTVKYY